MKLTYLKSASVLIEDAGVKILCDPWLVDGEYYGSWVHCPPCPWTPEHFNAVDYIYISHIHPDHFSRKTLVRMRKSIPVLIHSYEEKYLKRNLEGMGFVVRELPHGERVSLGGNLHIAIFAADNCNPVLCGQFFGCSRMETKFGSTQIDSLCVIDNGRETIVNVNDCPIGLAEAVSKRIVAAYPEITLLLVGYSGAGPYPHCFSSLTEDAKRLAAEKKKLQFLEQSRQYIELFRPRWYMPFAGRYTLAGRLASLNPYRGVPELEEAAAYLSSTTSAQLLLNSSASFDCTSGQPSAPYMPTDLVAASHSIETQLASHVYDYEHEPIPTLAELAAFMPAAYQRFERKRQEMGFTSNTAVYLTLTDDSALRLSLKGTGWTFTADPPASPYVSLTTDLRLLKWLLQGPRYAHWNNAEIGSHILYDRQPEVFERGLYHCLCFFHA